MVKTWVISTETEAKHKLKEKLEKHLSWNESNESLSVREGLEEVTHKHQLTKRNVK